MISVSDEYKDAMSKDIRNRSYIHIDIGVVNQQAQANARVDRGNNPIFYSNFEKRFGR